MAQLYEKPLCQSSLNKVRSLSQNMSPDSPAVASRSLKLITLLFFFFPTRYVTRATNIPSKKKLFQEIPEQSLVSRRTTVKQLMLYGNGHQIIINIWVMMVTLKNNIIL